MYTDANKTKYISKGRTIRKVTGGGGGVNFLCLHFVSRLSAVYACFF